MHRLWTIISHAWSLDCPVQVLPSIISPHLPEGIIFGPLNSGISLLLHLMAQKIPRAAAVILNTFHLDPSVDADLAANLPDPLPLGPSTSSIVPPLQEPDPNLCLPWLDRYGPATVVYVVFGTLTTPQLAELAGMAEGLEASGAPFIWSLKEAAWEMLPPGFLVRTRERGLVVSWAPPSGRFWDTWRPGLW